MLKPPRSDDGRFVPGHSYNEATQFKPGEHPSQATEFRPGQRVHPQTEFKKGQVPRNKLPVGSVRIRTGKVQGTRAYVKVAEPNVWKLRAVVVWEGEHGPVPKGHLIHHKDHDKLNDIPSNLVLTTRGGHVNEHRAELLAARKAKEDEQFRLTGMRSPNHWRRRREVA